MWPIFNGSRRLPTEIWAITKKKHARGEVRNIKKRFFFGELVTKSWPVTAPGSQGVFRGRGRGFGF
jgi:hypothetical protein